MVNNFVPRGFTDLSEMKEMMKYSNNATAELTKNNSNLTEKQKIEIRNKQDLTAMAIKNVQKRKAKEGTSGTLISSKFSFVDSANTILQNNQLSKIIIILTQINILSKIFFFITSPL